MNVIVIMVLTTLIGGFSILTGNFTPAYMITFRFLYRCIRNLILTGRPRLLLRRRQCLLYVLLPWGIGMAYTASSTGLDANELAAASMPWGSFYSAIILQWVYFRVEA